AKNGRVSIIRSGTAKSRVKISGASKRPVEAAFAKRASRAEALAPTSKSAEEPLRFAAGLYRAQAALAGQIEGLHGRRPLSGALSEDAERFVDSSREVLRFAARFAPVALAEQAQARADEEGSLAISRLLTWWQGDRTTSEDFLSRAVLRPYAEVLAALRINPDRQHRSGYCPFCGGPPWIAWRRSPGEMEAAQRFLGCALCGGEWPLARIHCPACQEEHPEKLPSFQSDAHPSVRIEACETCHRYVKSIDLSLDLRPIPEVDELLSLAMDVWANEQGFTRVEPGLAGV
ncbi:MAG TPA: formate dehydrogenase accessory protein FdhE, partial [Myxococcaceae bacterium]|nr:formate dehydrogenase accessory protein FdhE [Myxococcaceae bacterium]